MTPWARLLVASTVSNAGDGVMLAALPLLAASMTNDPRAVAGVTVAATAPWLLLGLHAGSLVDAVDRRRALVVADGLRAGLVLALASAVAAGAASLPLLYVLVFVLGACETVADTAAQTLVPAVVPADRLEAANGRLFGLQLAANSFLGPPLGGLLFAVAAAVPFGVNGASFAVGAALVATLPARARIPEAAAGRPAVRDGLRFVSRQPAIRALAVGAAVVNVAHTAGATVLVVLATERLHLGPTGFGLLLAAGAVGSLLGTVAAAPAVRRAGRGRAVVGAAATLAVGMAVVGAAPSAAGAGAGLLLIGLASEVWNVVAVSYRQAVTPEHLLGRVMSAYRVIAYGTLPVGAAAGGLIAARFGSAAPFLAGGATVAALAAWLAVRLPARAWATAEPVL